MKASNFCDNTVCKLVYRYQHFRGETGPHCEWLPYTCPKQWSLHNNLLHFMAQENGIFTYFKMFPSALIRLYSNVVKDWHYLLLGCGVCSFEHLFELFRDISQYPGDYSSRFLLNSMNPPDCAASQPIRPNFFTITCQAMSINIHFIIMTEYSALTHCASSFIFKIRQQMTLEQNSTLSTEYVWMTLNLQPVLGTGLVQWHDVVKDKLNYSPHQTRYRGAAKCILHDKTKPVGRVRVSGIEVLLTIRHIMLHTVRIQFFRAHELVHTFDGNSCLE